MLDSDTTTNFATFPLSSDGGAIRKQNTIRPLPSRPVLSLYDRVSDVSQVSSRGSGRNDPTTRPLDYCHFDSYLYSELYSDFYSVFPADVQLLRLTSHLVSKTYITPRQHAALNEPPAHRPRSSPIFKHNILYSSHGPLPRSHRGQSPSRVRGDLWTAKPAPPANSPKWSPPSRAQQPPRPTYPSSIIYPLTSGLTTPSPAPPTPKKTPSGFSTTLPTAPPRPVRSWTNEIPNHGKQTTLLPISSETAAKMLAKSWPI